MSLKKLSIFFAIFFTATKLLLQKLVIISIIFLLEILTLVTISRQQCCLVFNIRMKILERDTFIGNISPITGGFITENSAIYLYGI